MSFIRGMDIEVVHTCNGVLSTSKKNEIMSFAAIWMDLESVILSEGSQTEKLKYCDIHYMWNIKCNDTNELTSKTETASQT